MCGLTYFRQNLDTFQNNEIDSLDSVDADKRRGELIIHLPKVVEDDILSEYLLLRGCVLVKRL